MNSMADRLTRAYCLFNWLHVKPIPEPIRSTLSYASLEHELLQLKVQPTDLSLVAGNGEGNTFEENRLAFMVRYSGLTWSTCAIFCDAIENEDWLRNGTPLLVTFEPYSENRDAGLPRANISDFMFLKPSRVWIDNGMVKTFVVRWNQHEKRRMERFLKLAAARAGVEVRVDDIRQSDSFLKNLVSTSLDATQSGE
jgi:hypothetical protein